MTICRKSGLDSSLLAALALLGVLSVASAQQAWRPIPRIGTISSTMVYDPFREVIVMFGGVRASSTYGVFSDTWIWDGRAWHHAATATTPPGRYEQAMAYDWTRHQVVMYGGWGYLDQTLGDMWEWDGQDWHEVSGIPLPGPRYGAAIGADPIRGTILLYGGLAYQPVYGHFNDTWEWDGTQWARRFPQTQPTPFGGARIAFQPATLRLELVGGIAGSGSPLNGATVWEWNGHDWSAIQATGAIPSLFDLNGSDVMIDPLWRGVLVSDGQQMWLFDSAQWTTLSANAPVALRSTSDLLRHEVVGLGWSTAPNGGLVTGRFDAAQGTWSQTVSYRGRPDLPSAYDPVHRRLVFAPGWTWSDSGWQPLPSTQAPPVDPHGLVAVHPGSGRIVYVSDASLAAGQTWVYGPTGWTAVPFTVGPTAATGGSFAADPAGNRLLLWQGGAMWEWTPASQWRTLGTGPAAITGLGFDAARGAFVGCAASPASPPAFETWEWSGQTWRQVSTANSPPWLASPKGVYAPASGGVLRIAADQTGVQGLEVWRFDGQDWTKLAVQGSAPPHAPGTFGNFEPASYVYDASRRRVVAAYDNARVVQPYLLYELLPAELTADRAIVAPGAAVTFQASFEGRAALPWLLLLSESDAEGIVVGPSPYLGAEVLPLDPDPLLLASLSVWMGGILDAQGNGSFALPVPNLPSLRGYPFHAAALAIGPGLTFAGVSDGVPVQVAW